MVSTTTTTTTATLLTVALASSLLWGFVDGRLYGRCDLARELFARLKAPPDVWVCIAHHESSYDTAAVGTLNGDGSADHGLLQISDKYWCSRGSSGGACRIPCSNFTDDDISDDLECALRIHEEHTRLSGQGFNAWTVYPLHCTGSRSKQYVAGCFDEIDDGNSVSSTVSSRGVNVSSSTVFDIDKLTPLTDRFRWSTTMASSTAARRTSTVASTFATSVYGGVSSVVYPGGVGSSSAGTTRPGSSSTSASVTTRKSVALKPLRPLKPLKPLGSGLRRVFSFGTHLTSSSSPPSKGKGDSKKYA